MSNINISQLPQTVTVSGPELLPLMQSGVTKYSIANDIPLSTFKNTNMATTSLVASISAGLDTRVSANTNDISTLYSTYANSTTVAAISAGLNSQVQTSTTTNGVQTNSINTLFSTYANSTTVASISAGLNSQVQANTAIDGVQTNSINTLFSTYANSTTVAAISAGLNSQVQTSTTTNGVQTNSINTLFSTYANSTTVASISAGLNSRINSISTSAATYGSLFAAPLSTAISTIGVPTSLLRGPGSGSITLTPAMMTVNKTFRSRAYFKYTAGSSNSSPTFYVGIGGATVSLNMTDIVAGSSAISPTTSQAGFIESVVTIASTGTGGSIAVGWNLQTQDGGGGYSSRFANGAYPSISLNTTVNQDIIMQVSLDTTGCVCFCYNQLVEML